MALIGRRTRLESLQIDFSKLTGLEHLLKLLKLSQLHISNCQISDATIDPAIDQFKSATA